MPERLPDGGTLWHGIITDITERRQAEDALHASLREKEALLKEVHHRVKNNLQIISSLLRLQAGQIEHPATVEVLQDMQGRIRSMALLHETLYRSGNLAQVDLADYLESVCTQLLRATNRRGTGAIAFDFALAPILLDATQAVPCGLLVNELAANCLKHAFPGGRPGTVRVRLQLVTASNPPLVELSVADDGIGLPPAFDLAALHSLGLQLVSDLAHQLRGTLAITPGSGTGAVFTVSFPCPSAPR
jgi:two-component sensor histidine kinase